VKIHYCSDIHLEFGALDFAKAEFPEHGELLILAGDITLTKALQDDDDRPQGYGRLMIASREFFRECNKRFERVVYFPGNHEAYGDDYGAFVKRVTWLGEDRPAIFGHGGVVELNSKYNLFYAPLWTDLNGGKAKPALNDYRLVRSVDGPVITYAETREWHQATMKALTAAVALGAPKKWVVATHHCPHEGCLNSERYGLDGNTEHGYYTDLTDFITARPEITDWICGHTHVRREFKVHETQIRMNCRGYVGDTAQGFTLGSFEIDG
jgi:DNA repair exonuclease SbcCD nuclease subunit